MFTCSATSLSILLSQDNRFACKSTLLKRGLHEGRGRDVRRLPAFPGCTPQNGALDFRCLGSCKLFSRVAVSNLPSHHQLGRVGFFFPHPLQHFLLLQLVMMVILNGERCYLSIELLCITRIFDGPKTAFGVFHNTSGGNPSPLFSNPGTGAISSF